MTRTQRLLKGARLLGAIALILAATGGPAATLACKDSTGSCCNVCMTGKACGNTCIQASDTCTQPSGCACNG